MIQPGDGYIQYIVNPKSGSSSNKLLVAEFKDYLLRAGYEVRTHFTESLIHACELATTGCRDRDCALVAAAGGDGTIREAVHGLAGSAKPLLIIPSGTENLLANELGFGLKTDSLIRAFEGDCIHPLDLGRINGRHFTSIAGFGFDGTVVRIVTENRKGHISHLDYFWPIWQTFWGHRFPRFQVSIDGKEEFDGHGMVFVGNISRYAIGLQILHDAQYGDGLLDVCIYRCRGKVHLMKHTVMTLLKRHSKRTDVLYRQCRKVSIASNSPVVNTEIDGDPGPRLPVQIDVIPHAVNVLVPPGAKPAGIRTRMMRILD
ncbi:MAG: diacylglycerol kinase family lipid kinase [Phycisphaerae bacterium]|nr:diacylglycerol kinase family lipid kinase [Phycisphaerae bacterium]